MTDAEAEVETAADPTNMDQYRHRRRARRRGHDDILGMYAIFGAIRSYPGRSAGATRHLMTSRHLGAAIARMVSHHDNDPAAAFPRAALHYGLLTAIFLLMLTLSLFFAFNFYYHEFSHTQSGSARRRKSAKSLRGRDFAEASPTRRGSAHEKGQKFRRPGRRSIFYGHVRLTATRR